MQYQSLGQKKEGLDEKGSQPIETEIPNKMVSDGLSFRFGVRTRGGSEGAIFYFLQVWNVSPTSLVYAANLFGCICWYTCKITLLLQ